MNLRTLQPSLLASTIILVSALPVQSYTLFQGQGKDDIDYLIPFPAGLLAESAFRASLVHPLVVDSLNGLPAGLSFDGQSIFGGLARLSQPSLSALEVTTLDYCYAKSRCIHGYAEVNPAFTIHFSEPVESFGFWANDQNTWNDYITITVNGVTTLGPSAVDPNIQSFFGFVASTPSEMITKLEFHATNPSGGFLAFDQFSASVPVPSPLPLFGTAAGFAFSRRIRSRIKMARFSGNKSA